MEPDKDLTDLRRLTEDFRQEMERHQELSRTFMKLLDEAIAIGEDMNYFSGAKSRFYYRGETRSQP